MSLHSATKSYEAAVRPASGPNQLETSVNYILIQNTAAKGSEISEVRSRSKQCCCTKYLSRSHFMNILTPNSAYSIPISRRKYNALSRTGTTNVSKNDKSAASSIIEVDRDTSRRSPNHPVRTSTITASLDGFDEEGNLFINPVSSETRQSSHSILQEEDLPEILGPCLTALRSRLRSYETPSTSSRRKDCGISDEAFSRF